MIFLDPAGRTFDQDWEKAVDTLCAKSSEFAELWAPHDCSISATR